MNPKLLRPALSLLLLLSAITGIAYPLLTTVIAQLAFPAEAQGSLIVKNGKLTGSRLIGQPFTEPGYFWSRPSATAPLPYDAAASTGANLAPSNPALVDAVRQRVAALRAADPGNVAPIPLDLVTTSASGLDPHISLAAATYQAGRIAKSRNLPLARVQALIDAQLEIPRPGFIGTAHVNVLQLNLALDDLTAPRTH
ncbi:MAG: potassium-transporting ATPase subunit KdpC [Betaproteobacteria bacterium]|nr:potassium-transporting ATPase subunit KdpC [Betaproteobacteria bacterium]